MSALGLVELRLNGKKVGDDLFVPGWSDYDDRVYVRAVDVTDRLTVNATVYNLFDTDFVSLLPYGAPVQYTPEYANNQEPRRLFVSVTTTF